MGEVDGPRPSLDPAQRDTLQRFILRARRVQEHSLVSTPGLDQLAEPRLTISITDGQRGVTMEWTPPDEERFESLAARVRPFTLDSETVYYTKVLKAIRSALKLASASEDLLDRLNGLRAQWQRFDPRSPARAEVGFHQLRQETGDVITAHGSTLAAGWLYADLVHADPAEDKKAALDFSYRDRFRAAVPIFAGVARAALDTLQLLQDACERHDFGLDESVWSEEVITRDGDFRQLAEVFIGPPGGPIPELNEPIPDSWQLMSVDVMESIIGIDVQIDFESGGEVLNTKPATFVRHGQSLADGFDIKVGKSLRLSVAGPDHPVDVTHTRLIDSNQLIAEGREISYLLAHATSLRVLTLERKGFMQFENDATGTGPWTALDQAVYRTASELTTVESLLGQVLEPLREMPTLRQLKRLRMLRLALQGYAVAFTEGPIRVTSSTGEAPEATLMSEHTFLVGNVEVPFPQSVLWHPDATGAPMGPAGPETSEGFLLSVPPGQQFFLYIPERVETGEGHGQAVQVTMEDLASEAPSD